MATKELKQKARSIKPAIRIGKAGVAKSQLEEIKKQLKSKKIIKIKFLRAFIKDKNQLKEAIKTIAEETNSEIIQVIGFTAVLHKK